MTGLKYDQGKPNIALLPFDAFPLEWFGDSEEAGLACALVDWFYRDVPLAPEHFFEDFADEALEGVVCVLEFGAEKYAPRNWEKGIAFSRLYSAAMRHLIASARGIELDEETGRPHIHHAQCDFLMLAKMAKEPGRYQEFDDRPARIMAVQIPLTINGVTFPPSTPAHGSLEWACAELEAGREVVDPDDGSVFLWLDGAVCFRLPGSVAGHYTDTIEEFRNERLLTEAEDGYASPTSPEGALIRMTYGYEVEVCQHFTKMWYRKRDDVIECNGVHEWHRSLDFPDVAAFKRDAKPTGRVRCAS